MGGKGGSAEIPDSDELKDLAEFENTINNPNVDNMFGSQTFQRGPDGRQTATQVLAPELQQLMGGVFENMLQGPSQFQQQRNPHTESMINGFSERIGQRSGFNPAQYDGQHIQRPRPYRIPQLEEQQQAPSGDPGTGNAASGNYGGGRIGNVFGHPDNPRRRH